MPARLYFPAAQSAQVFPRQTHLFQGLQGAVLSFQLYKRAPDTTMHPWGRLSVYATNVAVTSLNPSTTAAASHAAMDVMYVPQVPYV